MQLLPQVQFSHVQFGLSHLVDSTVSLLVMHMRLRPAGLDQAAKGTKLAALPTKSLGPARSTPHDHPSIPQVVDRQNDER